MTEGRPRRRVPVLVLLLVVFTAIAAIYAVLHGVGETWNALAFLALLAVIVFLRYYRVRRMIDAEQNEWDDIRRRRAARRRSRL